MNCSPNSGDTAWMLTSVALVPMFGVHAVGGATGAIMTGVFAIEHPRYGWGGYPASPPPSWRGPGASQGPFHLDMIVFALALIAAFERKTLLRYRAFGEQICRDGRTTALYLVLSLEFASDVSQIDRHCSSQSMAISSMACHLLSSDRSSQTPIKGAVRQILVKSTDRSQLVAFGTLCT